MRNRIVYILLLTAMGLISLNGCSVADKDWADHVYKHWQHQGRDYFSQHRYRQQYKNISPDSLPAGVDPRVVDGNHHFLSHVYLTPEEVQQREAFQRLKWHHFNQCDKYSNSDELNGDATKSCRYQEASEDVRDLPSSH